MAIDKFKDLRIRKHEGSEEQHEFRIHRVTAEVGSWIVTQIAAGKATDEATYQKITQRLFNRIDHLQELPDGSKTPMRIYQDGRYILPELDLEYNLELFEELYKAALDYSVGPFLRKLAKKAKEAEQALLEASTTPQ